MSVLRIEFVEREKDAEEGNERNLTARPFEDLKMDKTLQFVGYLYLCIWAYRVPNDPTRSTREKLLHFQVKMQFTAFGGFLFLF